MMEHLRGGPRHPVDLEVRHSAASASFILDA